MCGIAGILELDPARPADPAIAEAMAATLVHRGPDGAGGWAEGPVALAHRRLAVIDPAGGAQPMANEDGTVRVVYNGELYNHEELRRELVGKGHRFRSACDTEVLVHLYEEEGIELVQRLRGIYAFGLWDVRARRLLLARDRVGVKPLCLARAGGRLLFASEEKALLAAPGVQRTVSGQVLAHYLRYLYVPAPGSLIEGVEHLPPAHILVVEPGKGERRACYWRPRYGTEGGGTNGAAPAAEREAAAGLREVLGDTVRRQLVADVPVGIFLSGGVDSSALVAFADEAGAGTVRTYTACFTGAGFYDERDHAREVAHRFGTRHTEFMVDVDVVDLLPRLTWHHDAPLANPSALPTFLLAREAGRDVKVVLLGTGGDEVFGGYRRYYGGRLAARYLRLPGWVRRRIIEPLLSALPAGETSAFLNYVRLAKKFVAGTAEEPARRYGAWAGHLGADRVAALLGRAPAEVLHDDPLEAAFEVDVHGDEVERLLYADLATYLPYDLLRLADTMTMAASVEGRVPLVDDALVAHVAGLPSRYKVRGMETKILLKRALAGRLPAGILRRGKHGFAVPIDLWLRGEMRDYTRDLLSPTRLRRAGILDPAVVADLLDRNDTGREDVGLPLWTILAFEVWRDTVLAGRAP